MNVDAIKLVPKYIRIYGNIYILDQSNNDKCFVLKMKEIWLWLKLLGHIIFKNMVNITRTKHVGDMPMNYKPHNEVPKVCQLRKETRVFFKDNEYSTTRPLKMIH